jgi:hypothetical protein
MDVVLLMDMMKMRRIKCKNINKYNTIRKKDLKGRPKGRRWVYFSLSFKAEGILKQCFSTGGTRRAFWWHARILNYYLFHYSIFKMLIALLKSFSIDLNVKKNIYKV